MALRIVYSPAALDQIERLPKRLQAQLIRKIELLARAPEAGSVKRLHGKLRDYLRARAGNHRIWYFVSGDTLTVVKVTDRKDGYD